MNQKMQLASAAIAALLRSLCLTGVAVGQPLPDGKGKAEFVRICTACHGTDLVTQHTRTAAEWRKNVNDMVDRGADGSKEEIDNVILYLITNFSSDKPGSAASAPPAAAPSNSTGKK